MASRALISRASRIKTKLETALRAADLEVEDLSHQHAGHAAVREMDGGANETHFNLRIVSSEFEGKNLVKRHRMVYELLADELQSGLHALSITAKTPKEAGIDKEAMCVKMSSPPSSPEKGKEKANVTAAASAKKEGLGWIEWLMGWFQLVYEILFQRIVASNLENPLPLPPINDLTFVVTGSTSGIGKEIARLLAEAGGHVVMAVRNPKAANDLIKKWQEDWSGKGLPLNIEVMELDLLSMDSVVRFTEAWNARALPLHALINNAGIFSIGEPQKISKDGFEEHMQVNHLAPALLSVLLLPSLIRSSPSRLVNVNSVMHTLGFVDSEDMNVTSGKRKFSSMVGYSSSKLAQVMFSSVLNKRLPTEAGINVVCVSPGIVHTNVARDLPKIVQAAYHLIPYFIFSPEEGCRSTLFAATDPQLVDYCESLKAEDWPVCAYINYDCRPANPSEEAHSLETSYRVWEKTLELIGLPPDAVERLLEGGEVKCKYRATSQ